MFTRPSRLPLLLALVFALPVLLLTVQCASLALDRPQTFKIKGTSKALGESTNGIPDASGKISTSAGNKNPRWPGNVVEKSTSSSQERKIWLWSLLPVGLLLLVGFLLRWLRWGAYILTVAASVIAIGVTWRLDRWTAHHSSRYPLGVDLWPKSSRESTFDKGEWETTAHQAAREMRLFVVVLAALIFLAMAGAAYLKRKRKIAGLAAASGGASALRDAA